MHSRTNVVRDVKSRSRRARKTFSRPEGMDEFDWGAETVEINPCCGSHNGDSGDKVSSDDKELW